MHSKQMLTVVKKITTRSVLYRLELLPASQHSVPRSSKKYAGFPWELESLWACREHETTMGWYFDRAGMEAYIPQHGGRYCRSGSICLSCICTSVCYLSFPRCNRTPQLVQGHHRLQALDTVLRDESHYLNLHSLQEPFMINLVYAIDVGGGQAPFWAGQ